MNPYTRLKDKWKIQSHVRMIIILFVFSITGSASVFLARIVLHFLHISRQTVTPWGYYPLRILIVFPLYQMMLIVIAAIFGQFRFFWAFERKMFGRLSGGRIPSGSTD